jgi:uncharacterized membrane protein (UPF0127 family)
MHVRVIDGWLIAFPQTRAERRRGLLGRDRIGTREALVLTNARSVHTIGMRTAIDVVVLDRDWRTLQVLFVRPGRVVAPRPGARHMVEVAAGCGQAFISALDGRTIRDARDSARPARTAGGSRRRTRPGSDLRRSA